MKQIVLAVLAIIGVAALFNDPAVAQCRPGLYCGSGAISDWELRASDTDRCKPSTRSNSAASQSQTYSVMKHCRDLVDGRRQERASVCKIFEINDSPAQACKS